MSDRSATDRGSTLMLMPVGVLIVLLLASVALDFGMVLHEERELLNAASAAANDAVALGFDIDAFRATGETRLDETAVFEAVGQSLAVRQGADAGTRVLPLEYPTQLSVRVTLERDVALIFAGSIPGAPDALTVRSTASAELRRR